MAQMGQQTGQSTQTGMGGQGASVSDRELLQLALNETKYTAVAVNAFALEAADDTLRRDYLTILGDVHNQEKQIFDLMQQKGYYNVKNANPQDISQVKSKFSGQAQ
ncbi:spore coat protein [Sporomusa sp.]|uniref:spore coat protein n=1 Tax=Sporomusa sp. TaxID=2078658 RepID=UPI002C167D1E|nr:spore coat protein [Sporomusa sp.]HWR41657.1 spore coat protein [Sporomusa sp.]